MAQPSVPRREEITSNSTNYDRRHRPALKKSAKGCQRDWGVLSSLLGVSSLLALLTWVEDRAKYDHVLENWGNFACGSDMSCLYEAFRLSARQVESCRHYRAILPLSFMAETFASSTGCANRRKYPPPQSPQSHQRFYIPELSVADLKSPWPGLWAW